MVMHRSIKNVPRRWSDARINLNLQPQRKKLKSFRGKPRSILFLGFNSLVSWQAAGNYIQERLILTTKPALIIRMIIAGV
jgi:hypothetical protein